MYCNILCVCVCVSTQDDQELIKRLFAAIRRQLDSRTSDIQNQIFEIMHDQVPSIRGVAVEATVASKVRTHTHTHTHAQIHRHTGTQPRLEYSH